MRCVFKVSSVCGKSNSRSSHFLRMGTIGSQSESESGGQCHNKDDKFIMSVNHWISNQAATFLEDGIQKLDLQYYKSLNISLYHVEKCGKILAVT